MMASRRKTYRLAAAVWSGSRAVPGSLHGGQMATYRVPATHTVSSSMSADRKMQWEGMGQMQGAGWVGGDTCRIPLILFRGFWWGSAPQMLLVQQPEWLSDGCKAMGPEASGI